MPLTAALQTLIDQLTPLPEPEQDYLAALFRSYFEAEQQWAAAFARTREQLARYFARIVSGEAPVLDLAFTEEMIAGFPKLLQPFGNALLFLYRQDPARPGSLLRHIHPDLPVYAFPLGAAYRFLGHYHEDRMRWFWVGTIADYEELISGE